MHESLHQQAHVLGIVQGVVSLEVGAVGEAHRLQEVQQRPQLLDTVLQRRACNEQLALELPCHQLLHSTTQQQSVILLVHWAQAHMKGADSPIILHCARSNDPGIICEIMSTDLVQG
jgi:hypothetical protein